MRSLKPTLNEVEECGGVIGYPEPGRYVLMTEGERILGGEIERPNEFRSQVSALPKYYPEKAQRVIARLDDNGVFTEVPYP